MRFDKSKLKRPHADKALEKFIHNATADAALKPKKGEEKKVKAKTVKKPVAPKAPAKPKSAPKAKPESKSTPIRKPLSQQAKPEVKAPSLAPKPLIEPLLPPVAVVPPVTVTSMSMESPLILQNDIKNAVTLNLYHNLFKSFKARCQERGKTPSDLINKFMTDYLGA